MEKKIKPVKAKKLGRVATGSSNVESPELSGNRPRKTQKSKDAFVASEAADRAAASKKLATRTLSTNELAALMQEAPGGATSQPTRSRAREFKTAIGNAPEAVATEGY